MWDGFQTETPILVYDFLIFSVLENFTDNKHFKRKIRRERNSFIAYRVSKTKLPKWRFRFGHFCPQNCPSLLAGGAFIIARKVASFSVIRFRPLSLRANHRHFEITISQENTILQYVDPLFIKSLPMINYFVSIKYALHTSFLS